MLPHKTVFVAICAVLSVAPEKKPTEPVFKEITGTVLDVSLTSKPGPMVLGGPLSVVLDYLELTVRVGESSKEYLVAPKAKVYVRRNGQSTCEPVSRGIGVIKKIPVGGKATITLLGDTVVNVEIEQPRRGKDK